MGNGSKKGKGGLLNLRKALAYMRRIWPFVKPSWKQLILLGIGAAMMAAGNAIRLTVIMPLSLLMEKAVRGDMPEGAEAASGSAAATAADAAGTVPDGAYEMLGDIEKVLPLAGIIFGGAVLMAFGTYLKQYFTGYVQSYTVVNLQRALVDKLLPQPMAFFNRERKGALLSRMTANAQGAGQLVRLCAEVVLSHPLSIAAVVGVMVYTSPILTVISLLIFPVVLVPIMMFAGKIRKATKKKYKRMEESGNFFIQLLDGIRVVKSFRLERAQKEEFRRVSEEVFRRERKVASYKGRSRFGVEFTYNTIIALALLGVGALVAAPWFDEAGGLPMFLQFLACLMALYDPARKLGRALNDVQESTAALDRIFELHDREPEILDRPGAKPAPHEFSEISFNGVGFEYEAGVRVLSDVDFRVKRGQMVAFVGQSGMGKSTLMDLIPRFYDPTAGSITIDGVDLRDLQGDSWLDNIAIVSQETFLFNTSVRENIMAGKPDATEEEVIAAARAAHIWDEIESLEHGLDTQLGDRGVNLSGGQRQRLAIARAFLKRAPILLLDEATSSLDTRSEREVQRALDELVEGCTVFAVAHRLSTVRRADLMLVLDEGRVVERGTHDELMSLDGTYARSYRLQHDHDSATVEAVAD